MPRFVRVLLFGLMVALLALSGLTIAVPNSAAQDTTPVDAIDAVALSADIQFPIPTPCPDGTNFVGNVVAPEAVSSLDGTYCRPNGFVPLRDEVVCEEMGMAFYVDDGSLPGICATTGWSVAVPVLCPAPTVLAEGNDPSGRFSYWCLFEILIQGTGAGSLGGQPICIESTLVGRTAPLSSVGTSFNTEGRDYLIHTGPPTCEANCHGGFDFNCDDKIGDFCPVELDLTTVVGVHDCIDGFAAVAADEQSAVPAAAPALPQVIPVATTAGPELAQTGSESGLLAYLGLGLIGFGLSALGLRRREETGR